MLRFGAKVPGLGLDVRSVTMDFTYGSAFNVDSPDAYETLILDALQGDASLFTRADEVEEAWAIVDPDRRVVGRLAAARVPELRRRDLGPTRIGRADGARRPPLAPVLGTADGRRHAAAHRGAGPALVGAGPQHRRHRAGADPDLVHAGPDRRGGWRPGPAHRRHARA